MDGIRTDYVYDVFGRRIAKRSHFIHASFEVNQSFDLKQQQAELEQQGKLGLTLFGWQGEQLAWESYLGYRNSVLHTGLAPKTTHYIYEPDTVIPVAQVSYASAMRLLPSPDYALLIEQGYDRDKDHVWTHDPTQARPIISSVAYYHCDHLGTPQELTDRDGQLIWSAHYKAWGEAKVERSERAKHLHIDNYHRYQGQYYDNETGLHYNRFRYYDPHLARYISRDPIGLNGGMNLNAYVPNPNQWVDAFGLMADPNPSQVFGGAMAEALNAEAQRVGYVVKNLPTDYFSGDFPSVEIANSNLKANGGTGRDLMVNANRLMVEPNGSKQWTVGRETGNYVLPVRVIAYRDDEGKWIDSQWSTFPTQQDRGYWVYGELSMSANKRLYPDTYNFEQHQVKNAFTSQDGFFPTVKQNVATTGRNILTEIGAINAVGMKSFNFKTGAFEAEGYKIRFFNQPICRGCPDLPQR